jgi:hypothetical protein
MGMKKDILPEIEEQQLRWYGLVLQMEDCRTAKQDADGTHRGKGGVANQSIHGRMGLGTGYKEETLRMKNVLIESSGVKTLCLWVEENCVYIYNVNQVLTSSITIF